ncbi:MAG: two-component system, OmpR family, response regulator [Acidimicrobiaceae bacterium]|jgi:DNA-binding winged helix-turn-helix (wHTH) protein
MNVELVRWPEGAARREELRRQVVPTLLLVPEGESPPILDQLEDWVRTPADEGDLLARLQHLEGLVRRLERPAVGAAVVDSDDVLSWQGRWVALPEVEAAITRRLLANPEELVTRDDLAASAWPAGHRKEHSLDSRIHRLRRHLAPLGLAVRTVRGRGFMLEAALDQDTDAPDGAETREIQ